MKKLSLILCVIVLLSLFTFLYGNKDYIIKPDYSQTELIYENSGRYYYDNLSSNAKTAYTLILPKLYEHCEQIEIPQISGDELDSLIYALSYDNPDLFCVGSRSQLKTKGNIYYYCPTYLFSYDECSVKRIELENAVNKALSGVSQNLSEYEKELYVHDYICDICEYESRKQEHDNISAYDVFVNGKAVCEGYSKAAKLLFDKLSVSSYLVTGNSYDENDNVTGHMWNVVSIAGNNYYLDITWDDMDKDDAFNGSHIYFNVNDEMISKTHFDISPSENNCNSAECNYYNVIAMRFNQYDLTTKRIIEKKIYDNYKKGINNCEFSFSNEQAYKTAYDSLIENDGLSDLFYDIHSTYGKTDYSNVKYINEDNLFVFEFYFYE